MQIDFDFSESKNFFKEKLKSSSFFTLFEASTPSKKRDFDSSVRLTQSMNERVLQIKDLNAGLAIKDKVELKESWNVADFATAIFGDDKSNRNVIYLSGRGGSLDEVKDTIARLVSSGFKNIIPITGDGVLNSLPSFKLLKQPCFDSIHSLNIMKKIYNDYDLFTGAVVNPFKYSPTESFSQYLKLIKKINFGANFIITQIGWDMMKHQELRWYLNRRDFHYPIIARIQLLTPTVVENILNGEIPGVYISRDFKLILEKENKYGYKQFAAAQWRRFQLQIAGCRLLGYSGIQVAGLDSAEYISIAASKIKDALQEFSSFEAWRDAYKSHLSNSDMAPFEDRFYLYKNLFLEAHPKKVVENPISIPKTSVWNRIHYKLCNAMFSKDDSLHHKEHFISKKLFVGCRSCSYCRLPLTQYVCPETCPKGLANGPCGGSKINGDCELRNIKCIYAHRIKIASWLNEIYTLEEQYVKHPDIAKK